MLDGKRSKCLILRHLTQRRTGATKPTDWQAAERKSRIGNVKIGFTNENCWIRNWKRSFVIFKCKQTADTKWIFDAIEVTRPRWKVLDMHISDL